MINRAPNKQEVLAQLARSLDASEVGAAASKLFAASIGDMAVLLSNSPVHKHYMLSDIEWMIIPPVAAAQFYIVEAEHKERGFRGPIAAVTWAMVSEDVDARLRQSLGQQIRLSPHEWTSGAIGWLIDAVGHAEAVRTAFRWLKTGPFKQQPLHLVTRNKNGALVASTVDALISEHAGSLPA